MRQDHRSTTLTNELDRIVGHRSRRTCARWTGRACGGAHPGRRAAAAGQKGTTALDRFSQDLTAKAASGEMDPIRGRDEEIRQVIDVLMRRRQNNPILTGEAGVGKTAVVEGLRAAHRGGRRAALATGVRSARSISALMQAGASMKGEFEQRLRAVIDEVQPRRRRSSCSSTRRTP